MVHDERIMEWDCGDWSGHLYSEIQQTWPEEWAALEADRFNYRGPNCENYPDMIARSAPFLDEIIASGSERIAIVSHGMIGKIMVAQLLGLPESDYLAIGQDNDVVFRVTVRDDFREGAHFVRGEGPHPGIPKHH